YRWIQSRTASCPRSLPAFSDSIHLWRWISSIWIWLYRFRSKWLTVTISFWSRSPHANARLYTWVVNQDPCRGGGGVCLVGRMAVARCCCQLPVASCQLPVASCQLPVASYQLPVTSCRLHTVGRQT